MQFSQSQADAERFEHPVAVACQESEEALRALQIMKHRAPATGTGKIDTAECSSHHRTLSTGILSAKGLEALQQVTPI